MNYIPFRTQFGPKIRSGEKRYTLRSKKYGEPGEFLRTPFGIIQLKYVTRERLVWVRDNLWKQEGCSSPEEFENIWLEIHPGGFQGEKLYYLHEFDYVPNMKTNFSGN